MLQLNPYETNRLKQLMASGTITPDMLQGVDIRGPDGQNALAPLLGQQAPDAPLPVGSMRNESTGKMTYFQPDPTAPRNNADPGFRDTPYPAQQQPAQPRGIRVVGYGGGHNNDNVMADVCIENFLGYDG